MQMSLFLEVKMQLKEDSKISERVKLSSDIEGKHWIPSEDREFSQISYPYKLTDFSEMNETNQYLFDDALHRKLRGEEYSVNLHTAWIDEKQLEDAISIKAFLGNEIMPKLISIERKPYIHDIKTSNEHKELLERLQKLQSENEYFRIQLFEVNTPTKLKRYATFFGLLSFGSLTLSKLLSINLLHPILAYFIFGSSVVFYIMSVIMEKQDKGINGTRFK